MNYADKLNYALRNLPARKKRGAPENWVRYFMYRFLMQGMTRGEAEKSALERLKDAGIPSDNLDLQYLL